MTTILDNLDLPDSKVIVAISGRAGAGKDTAAEAIMDDSFRKGYPCRIMPFAEPIRAAADSLLLPLAMLYSRLTGEYDCLYYSDREYKELPFEAFGRISYREFAQDFGDWVRNKLGKDAFVRLWMSEVLDDNRPEVVVVTDVRFDNEADILAKFPNSIFLRIDRPGLELVRDHKSERGIRDFSKFKTIDNDGSVFSLRAKVCEEVFPVIERIIDNGTS